MTLLIKNLTYTGNGAPRSIGGAGFQSTMAWVHNNSQNMIAFTHAAIQPDQTTHHGETTNIFAGGFTSLNADGVSLGPSVFVNENTFIHYLTLFRGTSIAYGTYTGDGVADRAIAGLGLDPIIVLVVRHTPVAPFYGFVRTTDMPANESIAIGATAITTNDVKSLGVGQFTIGDSVRVNQNGIAYSYWAFASLASQISVGTYVGDDTGNREISVGYRPQLVYIVGKVTATNVSIGGGYRTADQPNEEYMYIDGGVESNFGIQSFGPNGFKLAADSPGDFNLGTRTYYWLALGEPAARGYSIVY